MSVTTKKKKERSTFYGGLEGTLDLGGLVALLMGILVGVWVVAFSGLAGLHLAVIVGIVGFVFRLILRALAETIRLQKKGLGLPYGGKISEAQETVVYSCSECGAILHTDVRCEACGRAVEVTPSKTLTNCPE